MNHQNTTQIALEESHQTETSEVRTESRLLSQYTANAKGSEYK
jgi:hypothetical protein